MKKKRSPVPDKFICRLEKWRLAAKQRGRGHCATVGAVEGEGRPGGGEQERRWRRDEKKGMEREAERTGERKINKVIKHELRAEMTS